VSKAGEPRAEAGEGPARLLYFVTEDWFFCSHFIERACAARAAGYDVSVLTRVREHGEEIRRRGLTLIPIELKRHGINPFIEAATLLRVLRAYRRIRPDLVHHFALKPIVYGTLAARLGGFRRLVNAPVGMGFVFASNSALARLLRPLMRLTLRALLNPPGSRVVFENRDDLRSAVDEGFVRADSALLIRGAGVDTARFVPTPEPDSVPTVVLVARMLKEKGVQEYVDAARRLKDDGVRARFLLVGAPDPGNPSAVARTQLLAWQQQCIVEWLGQRTDIPEILAAAHIVCLPSYREGLPKTLLEALAAGRPIVTTDVPGCREVVTDSINGLLVPPRDAAALADALARLIRDPALRRRFGAAGRERAEREFATELVERATTALYRRMLAT
jgi:glycosyltransferase involved in cell wall biosynthesis